MKPWLTVITVAAFVGAAFDADAAPARKKKRNKQTEELIEQSRRNADAAQKAMQAAEEAKRTADEAQKKLEETKAADEKRRQEEAAERSARDAAKQAADAEKERNAAEEARRKEEEAKAAAQRAEEEKRKAEQAERDAKDAEAYGYVHHFYLRAGAGVEWADARVLGMTGRTFSPAITGGLGYRLGLVRLGVDYQGTLFGSAHWHKALANLEFVLGSNAIEFVVRVGAGYALGAGTTLLHGGAAKAGMALDFRFIKVMAIGFGADFDVLMFFQPSLTVPLGGTLFGRFSFFI